jgi:hypothetical protein
MTKTAHNFFVNEGKLRAGMSPPPFSAKALLDAARPYLEAGWRDDDPAIVFTLISNTREVCVIPETPDHDGVTAIMSALIKKYDITRYVVVVEALVSEGPGCPSEDPDSVEMLLVGAANVLGDKVLGCFEIKRDAEGCGSLGAWEETDDFSGWMLEFFDDLQAPSSVH